MRMLTMVLLLGLAHPATAQDNKPPEEKAIVITGVADGARVVEVNFDKVWKGCAECKRALAKLDKLARNYRDELTVATAFASGGTGCGGPAPSSVVTFQRSSAEPIGQPAQSGAQIAGALCAARAEERSRETFAAMAKKYVAPEQGKLLAYMQSFLDQLAPHLRVATEAERVAHGASLGLTDTRRTRLSARNLKRIDVTQAVIRRLDGMDFKIVLPDPPPPGPARGGYEPIR